MFIFFCFTAISIVILSIIFLILGWNGITKRDVYIPNGGGAVGFDQWMGITDKKRHAHGKWATSFGVFYLIIGVIFLVLAVSILSFIIKF